MACQRTVDLETLALIGIAEGNRPRTLAALKFLGLVSETNRRTETLDRIGRASTDEYPESLALILRSAYEPVFQIVDPAEDDVERITDAFRQYEPAAQRSRMVSLFMGLCAEAGIIKKESTPKRRPARSSQGRRPTARTEEPRTRSSAADLQAIHAIVDQLPGDRRWSAARRDGWMAMIRAAVDFAIAVREVREDNRADNPDG